MGNYACKSLAVLRAIGASAGARDHRCAGHQRRRDQVGRGTPPGAGPKRGLPGATKPPSQDFCKFLTKKFLEQEFCFFDYGKCALSAISLLPRRAAATLHAAVWIEHCWQSIVRLDGPRSGLAS